MPEIPPRKRPSPAKPAGSAPVPVPAEPHPAPEPAVEAPKPAVEAAQPPAPPAPEPPAAPEPAPETSVTDTLVQHIQDGVHSVSEVVELLGGSPFAEVIKSADDHLREAVSQLEASCQESRHNSPSSEEHRTLILAVEDVIAKLRRLL